MIQRGNIYFISVDDRKVRGCEQKGYRPGIIVSNNFANKNSPVVTAVFLTSKPKKSLPIHAEITSVPDLKNSTALCEQVCCVSKDRVQRYIGKISQREMLQVERGLSLQLGLGRYIALTIVRLIRDNRFVSTMVDVINRYFTQDAYEEIEDEAG